MFDTLILRDMKRPFDKLALGKHYLPKAIYLKSYQD